MSADRPETVAAVVNASLVMLGPLVLVAAIPLLPSISGTQAVVHGDGYSPLIAFMRNGAFVVAVTSPLAIVAAWRTWVHARKMRTLGVSGSRGILEAAAVGFVIPMIPLAPGIFGHPADALPYIVFYGGVGIIIGLLVGTILWGSATVVVQRFRAGA